MMNYGIFTNFVFCRVLNEKETILARKSEKLVKAEISITTEKFYVTIGSQ